MPYVLVKPRKLSLGLQNTNRVVSKESGKAQAQLNLQERDSSTLFLGGILKRAETIQQKIINGVLFYKGFTLYLSCYPKLYYRATSCKLWTYNFTTKKVQHRPFV